jgi:SAM-dependent methyltransferase
MLDPTKRFSNRAATYVKYRPRYPAEIIPLLERECGLNSNSIVADLGSGTGFLAELFLKHGSRVFGIEPNAEMRTAGEEMLAGYPNFTSVEATAEATTLPDGSVDFVTAGQAFHWFDRKVAHREFARILKPTGWAVFIWNGLRPERSPIVAGYQNVLLKFGTDFRSVTREISDSQVEDFFSNASYRLARFEYRQIFDFEGLKGRVLSASFAPQPGESNYDEMIDELRRVFDANQENGTVTFDYDTEVHYGRLD